MHSCCYMRWVVGVVRDCEAPVLFVVIPSRARHTRTCASAGCVGVPGGSGRRDLDRDQRTAQCTNRSERLVGLPAARRPEPTMTVARSVADVLDDHSSCVWSGPWVPDSAVAPDQRFQATASHSQIRPPRMGRRQDPAADWLGATARASSGTFTPLYSTWIRLMTRTLPSSSISPRASPPGRRDRPPGREGAGERPGESTGGGADHVVQRRGVLGELTPWSRYFCDQRFRAHARRAGWSQSASTADAGLGKIHPAFRLSWHEGASSGCSPMEGKLRSGGTLVGEPRCRSNRFALGAPARRDLCGQTVGHTAGRSPRQRESA